MQDYFHAVADRLGTLLRGDEVFTCSLSSETSDFVRMNRAAVRQAGSVTQHHLQVDLIEGRRHASGQLTLCGDLDLDGPRLARVIEGLREQRAQLPEDPHLLYATELRSSERVHPSRLPPGEEVAVEVLEAGRGCDLVGIYAAGETRSGFANSLGQRNWHAQHSFNLDFSLHRGDPGAQQAIKCGYAGFEWTNSSLAAKFERAKQELGALARTPRSNPPGRHRVYLAPAALNEIMELLAWGGFGLRAHKTRTTPLLSLAEEQVRLHPSVQIRENTAEGVAPDFQSHGFIRPAEVTLVADGRYRDCLVSPRSAAEYGVPTNAANGGEAPLSVEVGAGDLPEEGVLRELGTGVYISNLWYLNYSDRRACRTTGMTRFATFWVENGAIVSPLAAMRFDESVYRMLGEKLVGLTRERELLLDPQTYGRRSLGSARLPGALVDDFTFTL